MNCDFGALQNGRKLPLYFSMVIKKFTFDKNLKGNVVASNAQKSAEKRHLKWEEAKGQFIYQTKKPNEVFLHEWQINLLIFLLGWGNNFAASTKIFNVADISWQDMKTNGGVNFTKIIIFYYFQIQLTDFWATIHIRIISNFWEKMVKVYSLELEMSFTTSAYLPYKKMWNR